MEPGSATPATQKAAASNHSVLSFFNNKLFDKVASNKF